jgi:Cu2+-containing amine oxidase
MNGNFFWRHCIAIIALVWAGSCVAAGQTLPPKPVEDCVHSITQTFPTNASALTAQTTTWTICWREVAGNDSLHNPNGLVIGPVFFQKSAGAPQVFMIYDMRISEFFIPYHSGSPRFYDLSDFNFTLIPLTTTDCPTSAGGTLVSADVCKEVHDRGLMWKDPNTLASHRGEELVLWGIIGAANYLYLEEYTFRDDGTILGRYLATGQNLPGSEHEAHNHNVFWRIDMDLNGPVNDTAQLQHIEDVTNSAGTASDTNTPILIEEGVPWNAQTHDALEISNSTFKNAQGHLSTYHLMAQPTGGIVHDFEKFTQNEFWVTPYDPGQFAARRLANTYIPQGRSVADTDIVAWFHSSLHHHPRDEDGVFSNSNFIGVTDTMSTGFMLMPNDLFDCSPLYHATCP